MEFLNLAADRYSVRAFESRPLLAEDREKIIKAGLLAPTACNFQPVKIFAVESKEALAALRSCTTCHFDAPAIFVVCHDTEVCWKRPFDGKSSGDIDASIVATHMMLEAASIGVGSTWVMYFRADAVSQALSLPENIVPTCLLPMGYPAASACPAPKHTEFRPEEELVVRL